MIIKTKKTEFYTSFILFLMHFTDFFFIIGAYCKHFILNKTPAEKRNRHEISMSTRPSRSVLEIHMFSCLPVSV